MRVKIFSRTQNFWRAAIVPEPLEDEVNQWLAMNPEIEVVEIRHDVSGSVWTCTQLTISIYYRQPLRTS
jgi:hypothetical protein